MVPANESSSRSPISSSRSDVAEARRDGACGGRDLLPDPVELRQYALRRTRHADGGDRHRTMVEHRGRAACEGLLELAAIVGETALLERDQAALQRLLVDDGLGCEALQLQALDQGVPLGRLEGRKVGL